ncbi:MAG: UDP-N-acetylmuramate dehydrogenase [Clostridia bacterium]|nr:UDP-N-acetylmuramate dehydrogenase [Clostridia bacterium]
MGETIGRLVGVTDVAAALSAVLQGAVRVREPLAPYTTLRVGGPADVFAVPADEADVVRAVGAAAALALPVFPLGAGSNVIVPDDGVRGLVVWLPRATSWVRIDGEVVEAGSGLALPLLVSLCAARGLWGLEALAGVPGTVGGALVMNAGTADGVIGDVVEEVVALTLDGSRRLFAPSACGFGYRRSRFQEPGYILLSCRLRLRRGEPDAVRTAVLAGIRRRVRTQPLHLPNAGSIFKNPPGDFAGRLVEAAGCKGWRCGGAQVSPQHANFIVNTGGATATDVVLLVRRVRQRVAEHSGVLLEPEIRYFGRPQHELLDGAIPSCGDWG